MSPASTSYDTAAQEGQLAFLYRITHDDQFRTRLQTRPHDALAEYGLHLDPEDLPQKVTLPSKEALRDSPLEADLPEWVRWYGFFGT